MSVLTVLHGVSFVSLRKYYEQQVSAIEISVVPVVSVVCLCEVPLGELRNIKIML
jgi:hypothetical protein